MLTLLISDVMAQEATADAAAATGPAPFSELFMIGLMILIFYFLLIRPQQKKIRDHKDMVTALRRGDKVVTSGGLIGTITKVDDDDILHVEIAQDVKVKVKRYSIAEVEGKPVPADSKTSNDNKK